MSRTCVIGLVVGLTCYLCPVIARAEALYAVSFSTPARAGLLLKIDPETGQGTEVGEVADDFSPMGLIAVKNRLYTFDQVRDEILEIDPSSGSILNSINIGNGEVREIFGEGGMAIRSNGVGYVLDAAGELYRFSLDPPASVLVADQFPFNINGIAFDAQDQLYGYSTNLGKLILIDEVAGTFEEVGALGTGTGSLGGLAFRSDGMLFAAFESRLMQISTITGAATEIGSIGYLNVAGLTFLVPEPSSIELLAACNCTLS